MNVEKMREIETYLENQDTDTLVTMWELVSAEGGDTARLRGKCIFRVLQRRRPSDVDRYLDDVKIREVKLREYIYGLR